VLALVVTATESPLPYRGENPRVRCTASNIYSLL
jgi:hypothetical protein